MTLPDTLKGIHLTQVVVDGEQEQAVLDVLRSGMVAQGPVVETLENLVQGITGTRHAIAVNSGTTALELSLRALGIGEGDEVITAPITFGATLNAILHVGATARFADVLPDGTVDPASVEALVNKDTVALLPVHLYGCPANMIALETIANRHGLTIVEDAAQAIGAAIDGRATGSFGLGCFSLYATKNISAAEGGVITTDSSELADELRLLRNQGMSGRYHYDRVGYNARMTDVHAALAVPHLRRIDEINSRRRANAEFLNDGLRDLPGVTTPRPVPERTHVFHQYTIKLNTERARADLLEHLDRSGIGYGLIYPRVVFEYDCYLNHPGVVADHVPAADRFVRRAVSLPVHPQLGEEDLRRIVTAVRDALV